MNKLIVAMGCWAMILPLSGCGDGTRSVPGDVPLLSDRVEPFGSSPASSREVESVVDQGNPWTLETTAEPLTADTVSWTPEALEVSTWTLELEHPVIDMGRVGDEVWVATEFEVLRVGVNSAQPVEVWPEEGGPAELGTIEGFLTYEGGLFVMSSNGLFEPYEWALVTAPLAEALPKLSVLGRSGASEDLAYFAGTDEGAHYLDSTGVYSLTLDGEKTAPLGFTSTSEGALMVVDGTLYDMNLETGLAGVLPTDDLGSFADLVSRGGTSAVAYDQGLLWRDSSGTLTRLFLDDLEPRHVAMDSLGRIVAAADDRVVRVHETGAEIITGLAGGIVGLEADAFDHVWVASGSTLTRLEMGEGLSFETDIAPLFESECNGCHLEGYPGPKHDFTQYEEVMALDDAILERVSLGLMPPGGLADEQLEQVLLWIQSGSQP